MIDSLLQFLLSWNTAGVLGVFGLILGIVARLRDPRVALKILLDSRTWIILAGVIVVLGIVNLQRENDRLKQEADVGRVEIEAVKDGVETTTILSQQRSARREENDRVEQAAQQAPEGDSLDALLDQIALEQARDRDRDPD